MGITHVLRGEDLIDSTHRVLALRRALGVDDQPVYAHLPLILGPGRRQALEAARRDLGRGVPRRRATCRSALVNYLALLGWAPEDGREVLDRRRAGRRVRPRPRQPRRPPTFDPQEARVDERRAHPPPPGRGARRRRCCRSPRRATATGSTSACSRRRSRSRRSGRRRSCRSPTRPSSCSSPTTSSRSTPDVVDAVAKLDRVDRRARRRDRARRDAASGRTTASTLRAAARRHSELKPAKAMQVLYAAIEGRTRGCRLFDSIEMLGRESALRRLRRGTRAAVERMRLAFKIAWRVGARRSSRSSFVYLVVTFFQVWRAARRDDGARPSDAIVVLGAAQYDGTPSPVLAARLDHALDLYRRRHRADDRRHRRAPSRATASPRRPRRPTYLHEHGVPDDAILRETSGRSSWESLAAAAQFLKRRGHDPGRARLRSVPLGPHRRHRRRGRPRRGDVADAHEPDHGCGGVAALRHRDAARRAPAASSATGRLERGTGDGEDVVPRTRLC